LTTKLIRDYEEPREGKRLKLSEGEKVVIQKIGKMLTFFILFFSLFSKLYADPCADWTLLLPPARYTATMAYDSTTNQTILFGGFGNSGTLNDTFNWDGIAWTELSPATSPPARGDASIAFDSATNQLILFGGFDGTNELSDTWNWGFIK
jgi:hypothetical protein